MRIITFRTLYCSKLGEHCTLLANLEGKLWRAHHLNDIKCSPADVITQHLKLKKKFCQSPTACMDVYGQARKLAK